jgi:hypothetical protein
MIADKFTMKQLQLTIKRLVNIVEITQCLIIMNHIVIMNRTTKYKISECKRRKFKKEARLKKTSTSNYRLMEG